MITVEDAKRVAGLMAGGAIGSDIQIDQTLFRMQLVEGWQIPPGAKVLEVGCGQGDMTAALADAVGSSGHVTAVDLGPRESGAPLTLGQATDLLKGSVVGARIDFHFQYDVLDPARDFPTDTFDYVVLAHCSWYFQSLEQLRQVFLRIRPWAKHLCFSEWDMEPQQIDQVAHLLAVLIQGQIEAFQVHGTRNVRTPFSKTTLTRLLQETGWTVVQEAAVDASSLQDAGWEIDDCLTTCAAEADTLSLPVKFREFLGSQLDTLRLVSEQRKNRSLPSYSIVAQRGPDSNPH